MPERVMMKSEGERLHTSRCSGLSGMKATVLTESSLRPASLGGRNCEIHSELRTSHTRTVPSLEAETTREPSGEKCTSLTYEAWPRISLIALPDLRPCTRTTWSKEPETTCEPSREKRTHVTPCACALGKRRTHCPAPSRHTLMAPSWSPAAMSSESREKLRQSTGTSCIISSSLAWYSRSFLSLPLSKSHTSMKPSTEPETRYCPSGEKHAHSACEDLPNLITGPGAEMAASGSMTCCAAAPRKRSNLLPFGSCPWCCCHLSDWPSSASRRDGGTTVTCVLSESASAARRRSLLVPAP
mmetsp:Transcript_32066/g.75712  ORF Transcript_32066/g.75712 Transcript_32066/m.75712 type:complete len:299 (-) Transcript_32066:288-1184(-)